MHGDNGQNVTTMRMGIRQTKTRKYKRYIVELTRTRVETQCRAAIDNDKPWQHSDDHQCSWRSVPHGVSRRPPRTLQSDWLCIEMHVRSAVAGARYSVGNWHYIFAAVSHSWRAVSTSYKTGSLIDGQSVTDVHW